MTMLRRRWLIIIIAGICVLIAPFGWAIGRDWITLTTAPDSGARADRLTAIHLRLVREIETYDRIQSNGQIQTLRSGGFLRPCQTIAAGRLVNEPPFSLTQSDSVPIVIRGNAAREAMPAMVVAETNEAENVGLSLNEATAIMVSACVTSTPFSGLCRDYYRENVEERGKSFGEMMVNLGLYYRVSPAGAFPAYCSTAPDVWPLLQ